jgi:hypothetical protein
MSSRHLLIVAVVGLFSSAHADTIYVDDDNCPGPGSGTVGDPYCSIQTAIDNAVEFDEIVVAEGIYFETINFLGKAITVRSSNPDDPYVVANTTINGTGYFHVVQCVNGEGPFTILEGFTITGGDASGGGEDGYGGGMYNYNSSPTVANCVFSDNAANHGGGMFNWEYSSPMVTDCAFVSNSAVNQGGGMRNGVSCDPTVTNCKREHSRQLRRRDGQLEQQSDGDQLHVQREQNRQLRRRDGQLEQQSDGDQLHVQREQSRQLRRRDDQLEQQSDGDQLHLLG